MRDSETSLKHKNSLIKHGTLHKYLKNNKIKAHKIEEKLEEEVKALINKALIRAQKNNRKTIRECDV